MNKWFIFLIGFIAIALSLTFGIFLAKNPQLMYPEEIVNVIPTSNTSVAFNVRCYAFDVLEYLVMPQCKATTFTTDTYCSFLSTYVEVYMECPTHFILHMYRTNINVKINKIAIIFSLIIVLDVLIVVTWFILICKKKKKEEEKDNNYEINYL